LTIHVKQSILRDICHGEEYVLRGGKQGMYSYLCMM